MLNLGVKQLSMDHFGEKLHNPEFVNFLASISVTKTFEHSNPRIIYKVAIVQMNLYDLNK